VEPVAWNKEKLLAIWGLLQRHPTLFSDMVRGDFVNFANSILARDTLLLEIKDGSVPVGYFKFTDMHQEIDCQAHAVFFDRKPVEKIPLGRMVAKWMFDSFPLRRITAEVPDIATWTIHFAERIGFKHEGIRRKAVPLKGQWRDVVLLGMLREEAYGRSQEGR
jgi:hypothetical protein